MNVVKNQIVKFYRSFGDKTLASLLSLALVLFGTLYPATQVKAAVTLSYVTSSASTANNSTYTFSALSLGAAATDRFIIVAIHTRDAGVTAKTINSVTVGGFPATILGQVQSASTNSDIVGMAIIRLSAGTTGDVVVTFNETMDRAAVAIYRVTGISSAVPYDSFTSTASNPSGTMDVPADGFMIAAANSGANTTATWTGLTEDYDAVTETALNYTGAMSTFGSAQSNLTVQTTFGTNTNPAGIAFSWVPGGYSARSGHTAFTTPVYIEEDADVDGALAKGSGTFAIDHPMDPSNKILYHSFVESPDVKNIYDGIATLDERGSATIKLPDYFETLNKDYRFLLTPLLQPAPELFVQSSGVVDNQFTIAGGPPNARVSWQVTGIRQDPYILANPIIPEVEKGPDELVDKGEFLFKGYETQN